MADDWERALERTTDERPLETLAAVPWIVSRGGQDYVRRGTKESKGTMLVCLNERFSRPGVYEASMNVTLRELIEERKVFGVIGNVGTPTARATVPYALEHQVLFFAPFTGAEFLRPDPPDRYVFNYRASYANETSALVHYFVKRKRIPPDKIAVFAEGLNIPSGIAVGHGDDFYVGSMGALVMFPPGPQLENLVGGAIYKGSLSTGQGEVLVPSQLDQTAVGLAFDHRANHLFVAGGMFGTGRVYDGSTGQELWKKPRDEKSSWTTPFVLTRDGRPVREHLQELGVVIHTNCEIDEVVYTNGGKYELGGQTFADWYNIAGIVGGVAAAPFGLIDWLAIPSGTRASRIGFLHGFGNVVVLGLFALSWWMRRDAPGLPGMMALTASFLGFVLALATGWLGGELVDPGPARPCAEEERHQCAGSGD